MSNTGEGGMSGRMQRELMVGGREVGATQKHY